MNKLRVLMRSLRYVFVDLPRPRQALLLDITGQVLVLNYDKSMTAAEADRIKARIRADFPGLPVLLVCADNLGVQERAPTGSD